MESDMKKKARNKRIWCASFVGLFLCVVALGSGVVLGIYSRPEDPGSPIPSGEQFWSSNPWLRGYQRECRSAVLSAEACSVPLPRHYVAYKLAKGQSISIDGRLDDPAWQEVSWTENFTDIRGIQFPVPKATRAKLRYDSEYVYVGAWLEEDKPWATYTDHDSRVYQENAFEIFFDVDRTMSMYKEVEINVINTTWDLMLSRAYMDGGGPSDWEGIADKDVYTDGVPNNATVPATFWSVEMKFPFSALNQNTSRKILEPEKDEMWFMIMARPQYEVYALPNGSYAQVNGTDASWFSWQPIGAVNLHFPSRWGLLFFDQGPPSLSPSVSYPRWVIYQSLFHIFEAESAHKAITNEYTSDVQELQLLPYITSGCLQSVRVELTSRDGKPDFDASVISRGHSHMEGHIRSDRYVWFT